MSDLRDSLLRGLAEGLQDTEDFEEVSLFTKEELDGPVDVVRGMVTDMGTDLLNVLTEFFFLPYEDEEMLYFASAITVTDEIHSDEVADLSMALARINFELPCGSFSLTPDGESLVYKYTVPIPGDMDESVQKTIMLTAIDAAINVVDTYEGYLALVRDDNMTAEDMIKLIRGENSQEEADKEN